MTTLTVTQPRARRTDQVPADRRPPDPAAPLLLQRRRPVAGGHDGHRRPRQAGADLLASKQVAQAAIAHAERLIADREAGNTDAAVA